MKLPNGDRAFVDIAKLRDYCLDPDHPKGRHKARVFASALGISAEMAEDLRSALLVAAAAGEVEVGQQDEYGARFVLDFAMEGPAGGAPRSQ